MQTCSAQTQDLVPILWDSNLPLEDSDLDSDWGLRNLDSDSKVGDLTTSL
jgi:hypothetical protein